MVWLYVCVGIVVALLLLVTAGALFTYITAFTNPRKRRHDDYILPSGDQYEHAKDTMYRLIDEMKVIPYESVEIVSYDGLKLCARYYCVKEGAPLQIQFHGYRGTALRDFCGGNKLARENGFNTLVVDQRAHGNSQGRTITFGIKERYDCLSWAQYAANRWPDVKILLVGVSMGAATVLAASDLPLPDNVVGIIADCPYSKPSEIIKKVMADAKLPRALYPLVKLGARLFGHFDIDGDGAEQAVAHANKPILLLHGTDDRLVPCQMSRRIAENCRTPVQIETFEGAGHALSYLQDGARYKNACLTFAQKCIDGTLSETTN